MPVRPSASSDRRDHGFLHSERSGRMEANGRSFRLFILTSFAGRFGKASLPETTLRNARIGHGDEDGCGPAGCGGSGAMSCGRTLTRTRPPGWAGALMKTMSRPVGWLNRRVSNTTSPLGSPIRKGMKPPFSETFDLTRLISPAGNLVPCPANLTYSSAGGKLKKRMVPGGKTSSASFTP